MTPDPIDQPSTDSATPPTDRPQPVARWHLHRRLYDWVLHWAHTPYGAPALFLLAFAESSFFPVPPDVLLAPLTLGHPKKWFRFALACSLASVVGGIFGYTIGIFLWAGVGNFFHHHVPGFEPDTLVLRDGTTATGLFDPTDIDAGLVGPVQFADSVTLRTTDGQPLTVPRDDIDLDATTIHSFTRVGALYRQHDWKIVAIAGFTPLPYKVITITAGVFRINFPIFLLASAISRSARFFLVAGLFAWGGPTIKPYIDKYFNWLCLLFVALLLGGFLLLKYL